MTDEQAKVVAHRRGPLMVVANAGSGKTTTTMLHAKALIEEEGVEPSRILVTTFSKLGANDMDRKGRKLGVPYGVRYQTLHSVALGMIRQAHQNACEMRGAKRQPPELMVLADRNRWKGSHIVKRELAAAATDLGIARDSKGRPAGLTLGDVHREISVAKAALISPEPWTTEDEETFLGFEEWAQMREREPLTPGQAKLIAEVYRRYEQAKRAPFAYDPDKFHKDRGKAYIAFDDMIATVAQAILQGAAWVQPWHGVYDWVFVDEVQDNSLGQWAMVRHLSAEKNMVAIGDDQQSIYGFRGAAPALMREVLDDPTLDVKLLQLTVNFRSRENILRAANALLRNAADRLTPDSYMKAGRADAEGGDVTVTGYGDTQDEGEQVADQIREKLEEGYDPEEMAVLYRTNAQAGPVELALMKLGIPYRVAGSSFFNRAEIKTTLAYLNVALDPADRDAWKRAYCVPLRGLGRTFLTNYPTFEEAATDYHNGSIRASYRRGMRQVVKHVEAIQNYLDGTEMGGLAEAIHYITETIGLREHYRDDEAGADDVTDVDEACGALADCAGTLGDAHALVRYARDLDGRRTEDPNGEVVGGARKLVTLGTVHSSKGLEWGTVWAIGMTGDIFPHSHAPDEEERRLGYVDWTRAKDALHLSYSDVGINGRGGGPSSLLMEAADEIGLGWAEADEALTDAELAEEAMRAGFEDA